MEWRCWLMLHFYARIPTQPAHEAWSWDKLVQERAITLRQAINSSTLNSYSSALDLYLTFVCLHNFPVEPTPETSSFFIVFMSHHINPCSITSHLSGICQQLEPHFSDVHQACCSRLVNRTLKGCLQLKGRPTKCKQALTFSDLTLVFNDLSSSQDHDDLLFMAMLFTSFFTLMQLGELCFPNEVKLRNWKKITKCSSVHLFDNQYEFLLPSYKANCFFEGNHIIIKKQQFCNLNPIFIFHCYLASYNSLFPLSSPLWLTSTGNIPTQDFFITRLHHYFKKMSVANLWERKVLLPLRNMTSPLSHTTHGLLVIRSFPHLHMKKSCAYSSPSLFRSHTLIFFSPKKFSFSLFLCLLISTFSSQKKKQKLLVSLTYSK